MPFCTTEAFAPRMMQIGTSTVRFCTSASWRAAMMQKCTPSFDAAES